jgi:hypothetical protein
LPFWMCRQGAGTGGNTRAELALTRYREGSQQSGSNPSIKRMVQLRKTDPDRYSWESPGEGETPLSGDTRRSS